MSKLSEEYDNKHLVDLAKQQYVKTKQSTVPTEIIDLPSAGKVYPKSNPLRSGKVEMRYLTARDEDILTTPSFITEGVVFDKLLESIIISDISVNDIIQADKDALIIASRILAYGTDYEVQVKDPKTGNMIDRVVDLSKLKPVEFTLDSDENGEFEYELKSGIKLKFKFPAKQTLERVTNLLSSHITAVNNERDKEKIKEFINYELLAYDSRQFRQYIENNRPGLNFSYEFRGEDGGTFTAGFPLGPKLFWF